MGIMSLFRNKCNSKFVMYFHCHMKYHSKIIVPCTACYNNIKTVLNEIVGLCWFLLFIPFFNKFSPIS
jgi:hypothetical protein